MDINTASTSETHHSSLYLGLGGYGENEKNAVFTNSFKGTPVLESPVFRGDDPAEDESVDEQENYSDEDDDEALTEATELHTLHNWQQRISKAPTLTLKRKDPDTHQHIRFQFQEEAGSSQVSSHTNVEGRHDVSSGSEEEGSQTQQQNKRHTANSNSAHTRSTSDSETDLDGETEIEGRTKSRVKDVTAAEYESSLTYAKTQREVITRLHHLGIVKEPRLFLSHADKLELDKQRGTGKGHTKRSEQVGPRIGSPPFVKNLQEPGDGLKAPHIVKSTGRTNLFFKNKNRIRPLPRSTSETDDILAGESSIFSRITATIRKLFMQFQPFKRSPFRS